MKTAFITGCTGQAGSFLAELLIEKGYNVFGLSRRKSCDDGTKNLQKVINHSNFHLVSGDVTDAAQMIRLIDEIQPDEIYHLAAQSFVAESWRSPQATMDINVGGTLNILEAARIYTSNPNNCITPKIYLACSSEMFGKVQETPQKETTPFYPRSPYGVSKCATYWMGKNYRESFDLFICNGILFNNESERRGKEFVTRKITNYVGELYHKLEQPCPVIVTSDPYGQVITQTLKHGIQKLELGNLDAKRDWGYSPDFVRAMWAMLQMNTPNDFVIATGKQYSVKDFCQIAFDAIGEDWKEFVVVSDKYFRPAEVETLLGNYAKAEEVLDWKPSISFRQMVKRMVENDIRLHKEKS